jgi:hypothetical protein
MDEISVFQDKEIIPTDKDLADKLGAVYDLWIQLRDYVIERKPDCIKEWNYPGKKYGWSFRIKDKKRAIIYFLPREAYFKVALIFGQKAFDCIIASDIPAFIKVELSNATKYAEGRGIRIIIDNDILIPEIKKMIDIKIAN